jgi:hypothetical protein
MFVLRVKGTLDFICKAKTLEQLNEKINECFWNKKSIKEKGSIFEFSDYMKDKIISEIRVFDVDISEHTKV